MRGRYRFPVRSANILLVLLATVAAGIACVSIVLALLAYGRIDGRVAKNTEAIRVSCTLLANAIVQSGAGGPAQGQLAQKYTDVIERVATRRERLTIAELRARLGPIAPLEVPSCDEIAAHPDAVVAVTPLPPLVPGAP